jgi:hypothetical protein
MRINLEQTLSIAEGMYRQVLAVEDKLPNNIRKIIGLPEVEEPDEGTDNTLELVNGDSSPPAPTSGRNSSASRRQVDSSSTSRNGLDVPNSSALSTSPDAVALENQYEIGVSQFM